MPPVRYLRMLTNAVAGGLLAVSYLMVLLLQLNPQVPAVSMMALHWMGALLAFYGPYFSVALYFLILFRELTASRPLQPAWISVRTLAWLGAVCAAGAAALMWANLSGFRTVLDDAAAERMRQGAIATSIAAGVLVALAVFRYSFGRRGSRATAALLVVSMALSVGVPIGFRGPGDPNVPMARLMRPAPPQVAAAPRVRLLVFDGASLGFIRQRVAAGQLPNFGRLLDRGGVLPLATLKPTQPEPVWAAAATGKLPQKNGIRSNAQFVVDASDTPAVDLLPDYCFAGFLIQQRFAAEVPRTSSTLVARPLWDILADYGLTTGITNWPLTYPAHAERGFVVSDRFDDGASSPLRSVDARAGDPTTAADVARQSFDRWQALPWREVLPTFAPGESEPDGFIRARWDRAYGEAALELEQQFAPRLTAVRYEGLETFGSRYLREALPEAFGDPRRADPHLSVLDRYYGFVDAEIGRAIRDQAPGDLLLVVSGYAVERTPLAERLLARLLRRPEQSGTPAAAADGFLIAYGTTVVHAQLTRGAVVDLAPTVLYYMGVPVGRDMDGFARTDLFEAPYTVEHPVKYVGTHER